MLAGAPRTARAPVYAGARMATAAEDHPTSFGVFRYKIGSRECGSPKVLLCFAHCGHAVRMAAGCFVVASAKAECCSMRIHIDRKRVDPDAVAFLVIILLIAIAFALALGRVTWDLTPTGFANGNERWISVRILIRCLRNSKFAESDLCDRSKIPGDIRRVLSDPDYRVADKPIGRHGKIVRGRHAAENAAGQIVL